MDLTEQLIERVCQAVNGSTTIDYQEHKRCNLQPSVPSGDDATACQRRRPDAPIADGPCSDAGIRAALPGYAKSVLGEKAPQVTDMRSSRCLKSLSKSRSCSRPLFNFRRKCRRFRAKRPRSALCRPLRVFLHRQRIRQRLSELNDPDDQRSRFTDQVASKAHGDQEAMDYDEDFCRAPEYGMPRRR